jgi:2-C-methyl-D-erythritol 4-phosphate cytidylyltransferase
MVKCHALLPAAGRGERLGGGIAKQYLPINGTPMLLHSVRALLADARIERVFIVIAPADEAFAASGCAAALEPFRARVQVLACGGDTRAQSVLQALEAIGGMVSADDWVLVHDAARPCLPADALARLIDTLYLHPVGGLLAMPVADTLKRADSRGVVESTQPREGLWSAQTPQMFRHGALLAALRSAGAAVTDEAQAIEHAGARPQLVRGDARNLKVTWPGDPELAGHFLEAAR